MCCFRRERKRGVAAFSCWMDMMMVSREERGEERKERHWVRREGKRARWVTEREGRREGRKKQGKDGMRGEGGMCVSVRCWSMRRFKEIKGRGKESSRIP
jgi:hypothetical protein